ncbi:MAG: hypothetical protein JJU11_17770 [Candidatus Sumerlaeia bacterium]|nr:hypothetical protein [Candidatus Sumerlaeia bacterium]
MAFKAEDFGESAFSGAVISGILTGLAFLSLVPFSLRMWYGDTVIMKILGIVLGLLLFLVGLYVLALITEGTSKTWPPPFEIILVAVVMISYGAFAKIDLN